ncbi:hypothetical protein GcM1_147001 [Golovinomyces cichoracearum]|uniref:HTH CENPB-type domain-containing protein n=1 Tax=Golovinomyces cichoracearum TaxID=62708 RepID=A0A420JB58_9PEZI|nr:hypothetical protein GcM1_147001 [Golovinomyces cichoracearum]
MYQKREPRLQRTLHKNAISVTLDQFRHLKTAYTAFNAPYTTARRRVCTPNGRKLSDLEEQTLEQWVLAMVERGLPVGLLSIRTMANILLSKCGGTEVVEALTVGQK